MEINGKVALVTGGLSGIGLATTKELLRNGAKNIALADINETLAKTVVVQLNEEFGNGKVTFFKTDVSNKLELEDAFKKTIYRFETIDIVFNNAGIANETMWERLIDINMKGVVAGMHLAFKYLGKHNNGRPATVVNTASITAFMPLASYPIYSAVKAGIVALGKAFSRPVHYERSGIKILTVCPGVTVTALLGTTITYDKVFEDISKDEAKDMPLQSAEDVARHIINIIQKGENGNAWIIDGSKCHLVEVPSIENIEKTEFT